jgi:hypothetical protein
VADEDRFSLDRSIEHLAGYADPGGYPSFQAGEIVREGAPALAHTRYLLAGLEKRNPETAGRFLAKLMRTAPESWQRALLGGPLPANQPLGVVMERAPAVTVGPVPEDATLSAGTDDGDREPPTPDPTGPEASPEENRPAITEPPTTGEPDKPEANRPALQAPITPTDRAVHPRELFGRLGFEPEGPGIYQESLGSPLEAMKAKEMANEATQATEDMIRAGHFSKEDRHNGRADAFRHAYWNFRMAQEIGQDAAKRFSDAYERSNPNDAGERLMDLLNNHVGRNLARDDKNAGRPAKEILLDAVRNGELQTKPMHVPSGQRWVPHDDR